MTTASDSQVREGRQEGNSPADASGPPGADAHVRANSLTPRDSIAFQAVTHSARAVFRGGGSVLAALDRAGSLPDAQPMTLRQARAEHHRCAGHYQVAAAAAAPAAVGLRPPADHQARAERA